MSKNVPILLSFHALSNGKATLIFGHIVYTQVNDLSFKDFSRRRTFRTLFSLYRTRPCKHQELFLEFDQGEVYAETNKYGAFYVKSSSIRPSKLKRIVLNNGIEVTVLDDLFRRDVKHFDSGLIVVSDIDDTLVHSFITRKFRKFRTLMFTTMEKRKAVVSMKELLDRFTHAGAEPCYLSNSEMNLYPLIYRFLHYNKFPAGPLFLKHMRSFWDVVRNIKFPPRNTHKVSTLEELIGLFPEKKFALMGDNTQHDLSIYLDVAEKFPQNIRYILIRKVIEKASDELMIDAVRERLNENKVNLYYGENFPERIEI